MNSYDDTINDDDVINNDVIVSSSILHALEKLIFTSVIPDSFVFAKLKMWAQQSVNNNQDILFVVLKGFAEDIVNSIKSVSGLEFVLKFKSHKSFQELLRGFFRMIFLSPSSFTKLVIQYNDLLHEAFDNIDSYHTIPVYLTQVNEFTLWYNNRLEYLINELAISLNSSSSTTTTASSIDNAIIDTTTTTSSSSPPPATTTLVTTIPSSAYQLISQIAESISLYDSTEWKNSLYIITPNIQLLFDLLKQIIMIIEHMKFKSPSFISQLVRILKCLHLHLYHTTQYCKEIQTTLIDQLDDSYDISVPFCIVDNIQENNTMNYPITNQISEITTKLYYSRDWIEDCRIQLLNDLLLFLTNPIFFTKPYIGHSIYYIWCLHDNDGDGSNNNNNNNDNRSVLRHFIQQTDLSSASSYLIISLDVQLAIIQTYAKLFATFLFTTNKQKKGQQQQQQQQHINLIISPLSDPLPKELSLRHAYSKSYTDVYIPGYLNSFLHDPSALPQLCYLMLYHIICSLNYDDCDDYDSDNNSCCISSTNNNKNNYKNNNKNDNIKMEIINIIIQIILQYVITSIMTNALFLVINKTKWLILFDWLTQQQQQLGEQQIYENIKSIIFTTLDHHTITSTSIEKSQFTSPQSIIRNHSLYRPYYYFNFLNEEISFLSLLLQNFEQKIQYVHYGHHHEQQQQQEKEDYKPITTLLQETYNAIEYYINAQQYCCTIYSFLSKTNNPFIHIIIFKCTIELIKKYQLKSIDLNNIIYWVDIIADNVVVVVDDDITINNEEQDRKKDKECNNNNADWNNNTMLDNQTSSSSSSVGVVVAAYAIKLLFTFILYSPAEIDDDEAMEIDDEYNFNFLSSKINDNDNQQQHQQVDNNNYRSYNPIYSGSDNDWYWGTELVQHPRLIFIINVIYKQILLINNNNKNNNNNNTYKALSSLNHSDDSHNHDDHYEFFSICPLNFIIVGIKQLYKQAKYISTWDDSSNIEELISKLQIVLGFCKEQFF